MSAFKQTADFKIPLLSVRETEAHAERALVETGLARIETLTIAGKEPAYNLRGNNSASSSSPDVMVNSYTRAQTEGIDLICSIRPADGSALLILDSAGYDLDVAPRDSNFLSALCLILADATVLFVGGQLLEDDISRLASFVALTDQALLTDGLPHHVERRPGGDLTVLYSPVASGRPIDASVDGTQYTRGRFSVASGVRSAGRQIIQDNFGVGGIRGLSIPHVEEALSPEGGNPDGSILAKKVLARPGVRERLSGVTTFLLASPTLHRPPRSGTMVVETLRNAFALLSSPQVLSLLDTPSSDANNLVIACIVKLVSRERSSIVKFLATSEQRTVTADTTQQDDNTLTMETDTRIASAVALISAEPRNLGAGDDARVQEIVNVQTNNLQNAVRTELKGVISRRNIARSERNNARRIAQARIAAAQRNQEILSALQAEKVNAHAASRTYGDHNWNYHKGKHSLGIKVRDHSWSCGRCGAHQSGGGQPGGNCPNNQYFTAPTWDEWQSAAQSDGSYKTVLTGLGYDFNV